MVNQISSSQNPLIKKILSLQTKAKERRKENSIVIEGQKELQLAIKADLKLKKILFCADIISLQDIEKLIGTEFATIEKYQLTAAVFSKIAYRSGTGGIVAVAEMPKKHLNDLPLSEQSVYIVLESVEKPGNLGAICRVADAAKVDGLIVCDLHTDIFNPNAIRSSLGCVFTVDLVVSNYEETISWLRENRISSYAAELQASEFYHTLRFDGPTAFVFGTEATGLTDKWIENADKRVKIPMRGVIDSLNVTTSVSILVFEAMRQREFL